MPSRNDNPNRSETFGRLLRGAINSIATYEGRTSPAVEDELGQLLALSGKTIQRYKAGYLPPEHETVKVLAEAAVRRGYLDREWLQRFLHAARYPFADELSDQLKPIGLARQRPPRIYENLPAPTYSQFVMRQQAFADVVEGLGKRSAAVLLVGFGGNGKTSLAREVAARCLAGKEDVPQFDAVVWVSDKDRPGTTNLSVVLDEIARTLDYPGFTQFEYDEKRREVEQLLRRQHVLVVVDNFETITDGGLLSWLLNLPEPSKALITTREYRREFRRSSWPVDLRGMTEDEARELVAERIKVLKIEKLVGDLTQLEPLLAATGGNPKAIEMTMGLLKYERRPLQDVVDDLYAARGELFEDLFARAWALLDEAAQRVLMVMTFFPDSAGSEALSSTVDVRGFAFNHAVERLTDLALLDVHQEDLSSFARYALHPLVQAFARVKLSDQEGFEEVARKRWLQWYVQLASKIHTWWNDFAKYDVFVPEEENTFALVKWTLDNRLYDITVQLADDLGYYYYMRGFWDKSFAINLMGVEASREISNMIREFEFLSYCVQRLSMQGNVMDAERYHPRLSEIMSSYNIPTNSYIIFWHANAMYKLASRDLEGAENEWQQILTHNTQEISYSTINTGIWLAICAYLKGHLVEAMQRFRVSLDQSVQRGYHRSIVTCCIYLAAIHIDLGNIEEATGNLEEARMKAYAYRDRYHLALVQSHSARLHTLRSDLPAAYASLADAIDLFERLGMRRELAEAREEMSRLETAIAAVPTI